MKDTKKRIAAALLAVMTALAFAGCGKTSDKTKSNDKKEIKTVSASVSDDKAEKVLKKIVSALSKGDEEKLRAACCSSEKNIKKITTDEFKQLAKSNPDMQMLADEDELTDTAESMIGEMLDNMDGFEDVFEELGENYSVKDFKVGTDIDVKDNLSGIGANVKAVTFTLKGDDTIYKGKFMFISSKGEYLAVVTDIEEYDEEMEKLGGSYAVKSKLRTANANAKTAYNCVAEYVADMETQGQSMDDTLDGDFKLACSNEGIKLGTDKTGGGKGDEKLLMIFSSEFSDVKGTVYVGKTKDLYSDNDMFFIQFGTEDGLIGQYPDAIQTEDRKNVKWGEFYQKATDIDD